MIRVVEPDAARRIDLPGVGPVQRPLEVGRDVTGFARLSLRGYRFERGHVIDGEAEGDELAIVLVQGSATIDVADAAGVRQGSWRLEGRATPWAGPAQGVYLPPTCSYRLHATTPCEVAYARSPHPVGRPPTALQGGRVASAAGIGVFDVLGGAAANLACEETYVAAHRAWRGRTHDDAIWWVRTEQPGSAVQVRSGEVGDATTCFDGAALALSAATEFQVEAPDRGLYLLRFGARADDRA